MKHQFDNQGDLRGLDVLAACVAVWREKTSGTARFARPGAAARIDFLDGDIAGVHSSDPRFDLGAILVRAGKMQRDTLDRLTVPASKNRVEAALEAGLITHRELLWSKKIRAIEVVADLLTWLEGDYVFNGAERPEVPEEEAILSTPHVILELFLRSRDRALVMHYLGATDVPIAKTDEFDREFPGFRLTADADAVAALVDGRRSAAGIIERSPADDLAVSKLLAALLTLGLLHAGFDETRTLPPPAPEEEPAVTRAIEIGGTASLPSSAPEPSPEPELEESWGEPATRAIRPDVSPPRPSEEAPPAFPTPIPPERLSEPEDRSPSYSFEDDLAPESWPSPAAEALSEEMEAPVSPEEAAALADASLSGNGREDLGDGAEDLTPEEDLVSNPPAANDEPPARGRGAIWLAVVVLAAAGAAAFWWLQRTGTVSQKPATPAVPSSSASASPQNPTETETLPTTVVAPPVEPSPPRPSEVAAREQGEEEAPQKKPAESRAAGRPKAGRVAAAAPRARPEKAGPERDWAVLAEAGRRRAASDRRHPYTIQLELVCEKISLTQAFEHDRPSGSIWIAPASFRGRKCFRVFWGHYRTAEEALRARARVPSFFVTASNHPAVIRSDRLSAP
jgi:Domain of unknown function (DUF4388)